MRSAKARSGFFIVLSTVAITDSNPDFVLAGIYKLKEAPESLIVHSS
jgi:hypothetical protein